MLLTLCMALALAAWSVSTAAYTSILSFSLQLVYCSYYCVYGSYISSAYLSWLDTIRLDSMSYSACSVTAGAS
jgi:hypothetical protein